MPLMHHRMRAAAGRMQPNLVYVGGNSDIVYSSNPSIALNALTGGIASAAAAGDLVIGAVCSQTTGGSFPNYGVGTWTESLLEGAATPRQLYASGKSKRLTSADASITFPSSDIGSPHIVMVQVWRNSDAATPMDATPQSVGADNTIPNAPAITTVSPGAIVVVIGAAAGVAADLTSPGADYGFFNHRGVNSLRLAMAARSVIAPGAVDPPPFGGGSASARMAAFTFAIRPD